MAVLAVLAVWHVFTFNLYKYLQYCEYLILRKNQGFHILTESVQFSSAAENSSWIQNFLLLISIKEQTIIEETTFEHSQQVFLIDW